MLENALPKISSHLYAHSQSSFCLLCFSPFSFFLFLCRSSVNMSIKYIKCIDICFYLDMLHSIEISWKINIVTSQTLIHSYTRHSHKAILLRRTTLYFLLQNVLLHSSTLIINEKVFVDNVIGFWLKLLLLRLLLRLLLLLPHTLIHSMIKWPKYTRMYSC